YYQPSRLFCVPLLLLLPSSPTSSLFPYTTLFRSRFSDLDPHRTRRGSVSVHGRGIPGRLPRAVEPIPQTGVRRRHRLSRARGRRSEEHTSELQSPYDIVCRLLLEKKNKSTTANTT